MYESLRGPCPCQGSRSVANFQGGRSSACRAALIIDSYQNDNRDSYYPGYEHAAPCRSSSLKLSQDISSLKGERYASSDSPSHHWQCIPTSLSPAKATPSSSPPDSKLTDAAPLLALRSHLLVAETIRASGNGRQYRVSMF